MRDITQLHPTLQIKAQQLKESCSSQGLQIEFSECLRTVEEQDALYAKGRTAPGSIVTNAKGGTYSSMHQWGVAIDFYRNDGTGAYNDSDGFFTKVGQVGKSLGLEWGGDWKSIIDKPHFQLPDWGSTPTELKQQYGSSQAFMSTWGSNTQTVTSSQVQTNSNVNLHLRDLQGALNADGITDSDGNRLKEDGKWGPKTASAVAKLALSTKTIRKYTNVTAWVQCRVGASIDGLFGNATKACVIVFQKANGLTPDGIAGKNTIMALLRIFGVNC